MMDGATLRAGGVGCVERIRNPIRASRLVLDQSPHVYFVAEGAERFAQEHGMALCRNGELVIEREIQRLKEAQEKEAAGHPDLTFPARSPAMTPWAALRSMPMATSPPALQPEARSIKLPGAWRFIAHWLRLLR